MRNNNYLLHIYCPVKRVGSVRRRRKRGRRRRFSYLTSNALSNVQVIMSAKYVMQTSEAN